MGQKTCSKCKITKPLSEFWKDKRSKDGKMSCCITCGKKHNARRIVPLGQRKYGLYRKSPDGITKRDKIAFVHKQKEAPCECCGKLDMPSVMDFHHLDPATKAFNLGRVSTDTAGAHTLEAIKKEIDKCILVCAICHRKIHAGLIELLPTS